MKILVVNAGSSTHKLALYDLMYTDIPVKPLWKGMLDWKSDPTLSAESTQSNQKINKSIKGFTVEKGLKELVETMWEGPTQVINDPEEINAIGHRVVHGGLEFQWPTLITKEVKEDIKQLIPLAPLHNPANLEGIILMEKLFPMLSEWQVAVFDTSFHAFMPKKTKFYPIPQKYTKEHIIRYGFHGISHEYCMNRVSHLSDIRLRRLKMINCHLGNGSSLCAIRDGKSVDTSMGFTPLEGLMMGTRAGSIDPGILTYLLREKKITLKKLDEMLNFESGLLGICETSDFRDILNRKDRRAQLAFEMYIYRLRAFIGSYLINLEGVDAICFTAGVGENVPKVREEACRNLEFIGIEIDPELNANAKPDTQISKRGSKVRVFVVHTDEEWMIASTVLKVID